MRLKQNRLKRIGICKVNIEKDKDYSPVVTYGAPQNIMAMAWQTSDRLAIERYGSRTAQMYTLKIPGDYEVVPGKIPQYKIRRKDRPGVITLGEGDGICLFTAEEPDYRIIAIRDYTPLRVECEKI